MSNTILKRELGIASGMLAIGLLVVPAAIYIVGQQLIGDYATDAGVLALGESIWLDFMSLRLHTWLLVLSPYLTVQLARSVIRAWRPKPL